MTEKLLVMIIGACGVGKTTLTRLLLGRSNEYRVQLDCRVKGTLSRVALPYALGRDVAVAGNLRNTSDAVGPLDGLRKLIEVCWIFRNVVITDGFRCTKRMIDWTRNHPVRPVPLFVYLDPALGTNLARIRDRRLARGDSTPISKTTYANVLRFRRSARAVWDYAATSFGNDVAGFLHIRDGITPEESAQLVRSEITRLQRLSEATRQLAQPPAPEGEPLCAA